MGKYPERRMGKYPERSNAAGRELSSQLSYM
jgi:hypothetical protein